MTKIEKAIKSKSGEIFIFKPDKSFYETIKMRQKRWSMVYHGQTDPKLSELMAIAKFFSIDIRELI